MSLKVHRGDTLVEISFAIVVFCVVSILTVGLMDRNLSAVQGTLELNMARNEIDAQAEALRFIHNSYVAEKGQTGSTKEYAELWQALVSYAKNPADISSFTSLQCSAYYENDGPDSIFNDNAFVINARTINKRDSSGHFDKSSIIISTKTGDAQGSFSESALYPRVIYAASDDTSSDEMTEAGASGKVYDTIRSAEGLWVIPVKSATNNASIPEFYDFHIRTCWYGPGRNTPTTISTIIRLYNPDFQRGAA